MRSDIEQKARENELIDYFRNKGVSFSTDTFQVDNPEVDYKKAYKELIQKIEDLEASAQCSYNSNQNRYDEAVLDVCHILLVHKTK